MMCRVYLHPVIAARLDVESRIVAIIGGSFALRREQTPSTILQLFPKRFEIAAFYKEFAIGLMELFGQYFASADGQNIYKLLLILMQTRNGALLQRIHKQHLRARAPVTYISNVQCGGPAEPTGACWSHHQASRVTLALYSANKQDFRSSIFPSPWSYSQNAKMVGRMRRDKEASACVGDEEMNSDGRGQ